jgi:hypothetical protein
MPPRNVLSDDKLLDYSEEHVRYEIAMFFNTGSLLLNWNQTRIQPEPLSEVLRHTVIESFAIHCRNLIDFFYDEAAFGTDVVAKDFLLGNQFPASFPTAASLSLKEAKRRAGKEVSHLTSERIAGTPPEKAWPAPGLLSEIRDLLLQFVQGAAPTKLHSKVSEYVRALPDLNATTVSQSSVSMSACSTTSAVITVGRGWSPSPK